MEARLARFWTDPSTRIHWASALAIGYSQNYSPISKKRVRNLLWHGLSLGLTLGRILEPDRSYRGSQLPQR